MGSRRVWWTLGIVVVVAALALFGARGPSRDGASAPPREAVAATTTSASGASRAEARPGAAPPVTTVSNRRTPRSRPDASRGDLPPQVQRFLDANVYPPTSRPLTSGATDLTNPNRRYEKPQPLDEDGEITFVFTADRYYYTGDEVAQVWLEVQKGGQPAAVRIHQATARAESRGAPTGKLVDLGLQTDGVRWASRLDLDQAFPDHHGTILLQVAFQAEAGEVHSEAIRIFSTPIEQVPARVTGEFRDSVTDGSLIVDVGVDVYEPGFYRFDANLYDRNGDPVAYAVFKGDLQPGPQWLPLEYFGKILRDQGALGPYSIEQIRGYRFLEGQTPDRERLVDDPVTHQTGAYDLAEFSDDEYTSEHKERMIQLMLEDVDEGRSLDVPRVAGGQG